MIKDIDELADLVMSMIGESETIDEALNKFMEDQHLDFDPDGAMTEMQSDLYASLQGVFWHQLLATCILRT